MLQKIQGERSAKADQENDAGPISYLTGGPELQDGLSPTVLEYSLISTLAKPRLRLGWPSDRQEYVLRRLSSAVVNFKIGLDMQRLNFLVGTKSSSLMVIVVGFAFSDTRLVVFNIVKV